MVKKRATNSVKFRTINPTKVGDCVLFRDQKYITTHVKNSGLSEYWQYSVTATLIQTDYTVNEKEYLGTGPQVNINNSVFYIDTINYHENSAITNEIKILVLLSLHNQALPETNLPRLRLTCRLLLR